jgi:hypothetical protein
VAEGARFREIDHDEGKRLLWIIRRDTGSVVTWRRPRWCCRVSQGMPDAGNEEQPK